MHRIEKLLDAALDVASETRSFVRRAREALGPEPVEGMESRFPSASGPGRGERALAVLNGMWGDRLHRRASELAFPMTLRLGGAALPLEAEAIAAAMTAPTPRVVVFVHGWSCTEDVWVPPPRDGAPPGSCYGDRLREDLGYTPLYVRYNTGLHVSENGRSLSELLERLKEVYPVELRELVLVGHSMGGLVVRSAASQADDEGAGWVSTLRHVVCLGSPHLGSILEQGAHLLTSALGEVPTEVTQAWTDILETRSSGIKDLRFGYTRDEEWRDRDPDAFFEDGRKEPHLVGGVGYHFAAATLTRAPDSPWGRLVGDLFVRAPSAAGRSHQPARRLPFSSGRVLGGLDHFALARHPDVYEVLREALASPPKGDASSAGGR